MPGPVGRPDGASMSPASSRTLHHSPSAAQDARRQAPLYCSIVGDYALTRVSIACGSMVFIILCAIFPRVVRKNRTPLKESTALPKAKNAECVSHTIEEQQDRHDCGRAIRWRSCAVWWRSFFAQAAAAGVWSARGLRRQAAPPAVQTNEARLGSAAQTEHLAPRRLSGSARRAPAAPTRLTSA